MSAGTIELRQSNGSTRQLVMGRVGNIDIDNTIFLWFLMSQQTDERDFGISRKFKSTYHLQVLSLS